MKNTTALKLSFLVASLVVMHDVNAGQTAMKECLNADCSQFELHIKISSDRDVGLPGVYGVLAVLKEPTSRDGQVAYWTEDKQWSPLIESEIIKPTTNHLAPIKDARDFTVFTGTDDEFCKLTHGNDANLFAWHIGMKKTQLGLTERFLARFGVAGWEAENFRNSMYFYEANHQNKVGWVYKYTCRRLR